MKHWKLLVILILTTFQSFSQSVTVNDTIVCLPKSYLISAIQDIKSGDFCKAELLATRKIVTLKDAQLLEKDSVIINYKGVIRRYKYEVNDLNDLIDVKDDQIKLYLVKAKKERRKRIAIIASGTTIAIGSIAAIIWLSL
jgi:hypothetical protein